MPISGFQAPTFRGTRFSRLVRIAPARLNGQPQANGTVDLKRPTQVATARMTAMCRLRAMVRRKWNADPPALAQVLDVMQALANNAGDAAVENANESTRIGNVPPTA